MIKGKGKRSKGEKDEEIKKLWKKKVKRSSNFKREREREKSSRDMAT